MKIGLPTPDGEFSRDVLGRYICNTFDEVLVTIDPNARAAAGLPGRGDLRPFDFIIVGGGTFGSVLAEDLWFRATSRAERILVLAQRFATKADRFAALGRRRRAPGLECFLRALDDRVVIRRRSRVHATDDFVRARVDHFDCAGIAGLRPFAIAEIRAGFGVGEAERLKDCSGHENSRNCRNLAAPDGAKGA